MSKIKQWKELRRESLFYKYGRGLDKVIYELPDGHEADFYIKNESDCVAILALTEDSEVILVRQYRPGPAKILYEMPGGYIDEGESPMQAAERELLEETGYTGKLQKIGVLNGNAYSNGIEHGFIALDCCKVAEPVQTETEEVEVSLVSLKEFRNKLKRGKQTDTALSYIALDHLGAL